MKSTEFFFESPGLLLLAVPAVLVLMTAWRFLRGREHASPIERPALVMRTIEVLLLVLLVAGPCWVTHSQETAMAILADRSQSMAAVQAQVDALTQEITQRAPAGSVVGVLDFAGDCMQTGGANELSRDGTDIAAALTAAGHALEGRAGKRAVLISDGAATDGDAAQAAQLLREQGVRLDVMHIDTGVTAPEAEMTAFSMPADASEGQRLTASVTVMASGPMDAVLRICDGEKTVHEEAVSLLAGKNSLTCSLTASGVGEHTYRAEIAAAEDAVPQNNARYACTRVQSSARVLLVDGVGTATEILLEGKKMHTDPLAELLKDSGFSVDVVKSGELPGSLSALCEYGLIVLMNVDAAELPEGSAERLQAYVSEYGRSLLTTGGEKTYIYGSMKGTAFEEFLPVNMSVEEMESAEPVALMLVIDVTDSMTRASSGVPIEMARRGAIKCIDALNANDYAGVITFSDEAQVLVEMTPMAQKGEVIDAINGIKTADPDKLTMFTDALQTACDTLSAFDALEKKHIIFITDGSPADGKQGFDGIAKQMRANGITLSTIAVGRIMNVVKLLEGLSAIGGGRCYFVEGASDLPDIMSTDTVLSQVEYTVTEPVIPQVGTPVFAIDSEEALTQLFGYVRTSAKGGASMALRTPEGRPLYAQWDVGVGKAASLMSDLSGDWSRTWFLSDAGRAMIRSMIKGLLPDALSQAGVDVRFETGGVRGRLTAPDAPQGTEAASAQVTFPDGSCETVTLLQGEDGLFSAEIPLRGEGRYALSLTWLDAGGAVLDEHETAVAHSWSREYETLSRPDGALLLMELAGAAGGARVSSAEELLAVDMGTTPQEHDAALPLAMAVMALLLADIVMRRTKLKYLRAFLRARTKR